MLKFIKSKKGLSFIELIIVCSIIGILSVFALSSFAQMRKSVGKSLSGIPTGLQEIMLDNIKDNFESLKEASSDDVDIDSSAILEIVRYMSTNPLYTPAQNTNFTTELSGISSSLNKGETAIILCHSDSSNGTISSSIFRFDKYGRFLPQITK